uniref:Natriuretic peptide A n=1 Tax=Sphaeramia orbicularis TaxID=375764 RepID=A0A673BEN3_9TELE
LESTTIPWVLLALMCQRTLISGHALGRPASTADLAQIKSLLQHFEQTLTEAGQEDNSEPDYEDQQSEQDQAGPGWTLNQDLFPDRSQPQSAEDGRTQSHRSRLQDLLLTARKRSSGCFGARMDRIGNASGLGCNSGRGEGRLS